MSDKNPFNLPELPKTAVNPYGTPKKEETKSFDFSKKNTLPDGGYQPVIEKPNVEPPANTDLGADASAALAEKQAKYFALVQESTELLEERKFEEAHAKAQEAAALSYSDEGAAALLAKIEAARNMVDIETQSLAYAKELLAQEKGIKEVTALVNEKFGTTYSWQWLNSKTKVAPAAPAEGETTTPANTDQGNTVGGAPVVNAEENKTTTPATE